VRGLRAPSSRAHPQYRGVVTMLRTVLRLFLAACLAGMLVTLGVCTVPTQAFALWGLTTRASLGPAGLQANNYSDSPVISADGRYVAFASGATNLVTGETGGQRNIFVRDRITGVTTRASVGLLGAQPNQMCFAPCISADGRYVAFQSMATNLVTTDTVGQAQVFVRDRVLNVTSLVSVDSLGSPGSGAAPAISADGRYVAFESGASTLVINDTNAKTDIFVHDRITGVTTRESMGPAAQGNGDSTAASISGDGRYVAFESLATDFAASDSNGASDIFVRDRLAGTTTRMSMDSLAVPTNGDSTGPSISSDGRYVAFESMATNLVAGDTNLAWDVFVRDRVAATTTRASVGPLGVEGNGPSGAPVLSGDGRRVTFESQATNLVTGDTNGTQDVFMRDRLSSTTTRMSVDSAGGPGSLASSEPCISGDGRYVAFGSVASNLVASDTNLSTDIFVHEAPAMSTSITIKTSATTARIGNVPILSGAVTPNSLIGRNIVVYVKKPGKTYWSYSSNRTVYNLGGNAAWLYKYTFKPGMTKGYYVFKAGVPEYPGYLPSMSAGTVTIRLR
jgi:Tol biopolymer transport system component